MIPREAIAMEDQIFQLITFAVSIIGLVIEIYQWKKYPNERYWIYATGLWLSHAVFFYTYIILDRYFLDLAPFFGSYTLWSSIFRMQIIVTVVSLEIGRVVNKRLVEKKESLLESMKISAALDRISTNVEKNQEIVIEIKSILEKRCDA